MHTIAIFQKAPEAENASALLDDFGVPTEIISQQTPSDKALFLLKAEDTETEKALKTLAEQQPSGLMSCENCGSHELNYPATPNHTLLSRLAGKVAMKTHLVEERIICADCRNEWTP